MARDRKLCDRCARRGIANWRGWPKTNPLPEIPALVDNECPVCGATIPLDPTWIVFLNHHGPYNTGLPDSFELRIIAPGSENYDFLRRFGLPYVEEVEDPLSGPVRKTVFLVSCVSLKRREPCRARDLYVSAWFKKARAHVEAQNAMWFILSAEHGLVGPDAVIAPYERTLNRMGIAERRAWARRVLEQLGSQLRGRERVVVLAGERYRQFLMPRLREFFPTVEVPLAGLGIGEQLHWFDEQQLALPD